MTYIIYKWENYIYKKIKFILKNLIDIPIFIILNNNYIFKIFSLIDFAFIRSYKRLNNTCGPLT